MPRRACRLSASSGRHVEVGAEQGGLLAADVVLIQLVHVHRRKRVIRLCIKSGLSIGRSTATLQELWDSLFPMVYTLHRYAALTKQRQLGQRWELALYTESGLTGDSTPLFQPRHDGKVKEQPYELLQTVSAGQRDRETTAANLGLGNLLQGGRQDGRIGLSSIASLRCIRL